MEDTDAISLLTEDEEEKPSASSSSSTSEVIFGVPFADNNGIKVRLYPTAWTPDGWMMTIPNIERIKNGRSEESLRNGVGKGIAGDIPLNYPMPTSSGDRQLLQKQITQALDEVRFYRKYHELLCIHAMLKMDLNEWPTCDRPTPVQPKPNSLVNGLKSDARPSLVQFVQMCDNMRKAEKGEGMGGAAKRNATASESLELARKISGDKGYMVSGDALGAEGGMRHVMNLRYKLWVEFGGKDLPVGEWGLRMQKYDAIHGSSLSRSAPAVLSLLAAATHHLSREERLKALEDYDGANGTRILSSAAAQHMKVKLIVDALTGGPGRAPAGLYADVAAANGIRPNAAVQQNLVREQVEALADGPGRAPAGLYAAIAAENGLKPSASTQQSRVREQVEALAGTGPAPPGLFAAVSAANGLKPSAVTQSDMKCKNNYTKLNAALEDASRVIPPTHPAAHVIAATSNQSAPVPAPLYRLFNPAALQPQTHPDGSWAPTKVDDIHDSNGKSDAKQKKAKELHTIFANEATRKYPPGTTVWGFSGHFLDETKILPLMTDDYEVVHAAMKKAANEVIIGKETMESSKSHKATTTLNVLAARFKNGLTPTTVFNKILAVFYTEIPLPKEIGESSTSS